MDGLAVHAYQAMEFRKRGWSDAKFGRGTMVSTERAPRVRARTEPITKSTIHVDGIRLHGVVAVWAEQGWRDDEEETVYLQASQDVALKIVVMRKGL